MPRIGDTIPKGDRGDNLAVEEGSWPMTFLGFGRPYESQFIDENSGLKRWQLKGYYQFDQTSECCPGERFFEFIGASTFDGQSKSGNAKASKLFQRLRALVGVKNSDEADALDFDDIKDIPVIGTFVDDGKVRLVSIKRRAALPAAAQRSGGTAPQRIEAPTLESIRNAFVASGRSTEEFKTFAIAQLGGAKTVTPDQRIRLMKTVNALPSVGGNRIGELAAAADLDLDNEEIVDF